MSHSFENSGNNAPLDDASVFVPVLDEARLLVVDDEESLRITTAAIFEKEGYVVDTASSGDEAIDLLSKTDYDLVLTDLHMEGGDGLSRPESDQASCAFDDLSGADGIRFRGIRDRGFAGRRLRLPH